MIEIENLDKTFKNLKGEVLEKKIFKHCIFVDCSFLGNKLNKTQFEDCLFENCNLTMPKIMGTEFKNIQFKKCKIARINFSRVKNKVMFFSFEKFSLIQCISSDLILRESNFIGCEIDGTDFLNIDLFESNFKSSRFKETIFQNCNLIGSNFLKTERVKINPAINKMEKARFDKENLFGLVSYFGIKIN